MPQVLTSLKQLPVLVWYGFSGLCLGIGFLVPPLWWTVFVGIAVFFVAVEHTRSLRYAAVGGLVAFTGKMLLSVGWFWSTYPIDWIDASARFVQLPLIGFYWGTVALAIGVSGSVLAVVLWKLKNWSIPGGGFFSAAILWPLSEVLGAWIFSVFTYGTGGTLNTLFSFGMSGYHLAAHPWLFLLAQWGGVYLLSSTAALVGYSLYVYRHSIGKSVRGRWVVGTVCACVVVLMYIPVPQTMGERLGQIVAVVDTRFGGAEYHALPNKEAVRLTQMQEALSAALRLNPDYIVMSEDSQVLDSRFSAEEKYGLFRFIYSDPTAVVIEAGQVPHGTTAALRATIYDGQAKEVYVTDKQFLVPQGEYVPIFYLSVLSLIGQKETVAHMKTRFAYEPGRDEQGTFREYVPAVLFCFSEADPLAVRRLLRERDVPFVAHPISHAWFHTPTSLWYQFDAMLRVQALWNNLPIVSAGNMVTGALYTAHGQKVALPPVASGEYWTVSLTEL
jgi:apolipoprotein N-acyltransferase